tara:strand:- start:1206 stop:1400 length:195 start_codon:yes stop_codon:yes gene_type:complete
VEKQERKKQMQKDKNILKAIQPIKMFKFFYGKYPNQESIRAVCNINNKQYKSALQIAKKEMGDQ